MFAEVLENSYAAPMQTDVRLMQTESTPEEGSSAAEIHFLMNPGPDISRRISAAQT